MVVNVVVVFAVSAAALEERNDAGEEESDGSTKKHPHGGTVLCLKSSVVGVALGKTVNGKVDDHDDERDDESKESEEGGEEESKLVAHPCDECGEESNTACNRKQDVCLCRVVNAVPASVASDLREPAAEVVAQFRARALVVACSLAHAPSAKSVKLATNMDVEETKGVDDWCGDCELVAIHGRRIIAKLTRNDQEQDKAREEQELAEGNEEHVGEDVMSSEWRRS